MEFNLADLFEAVSATVPERLAVVAGDDRFTYRALDERADRLATAMTQAGIGTGDFVGVQLPNGNEYLEAMLAAFKIRAVPANVNYRYVGDELAYLYRDAGLVELISRADFAGPVAEAIASMKDQQLMLTVGEGGDYETTLEANA